MKALPLPRGTAFIIGFVLLGAYAAAQGNAAATDIPQTPVGDKTVPAGQVLVKASPDYQPIEPGWYHAKTAHFDVYTKDAKIGRKIADELIEVRSILEITWPAVLTIREIPITIVGCSGQNGFHEWSAQPPTDISSTLAGPAIHIIVNADVAEIQTEARRAYLLALLNRIPGIKRWLAEGLANIIKGAEYANGEIKIGENKRPPLAQLSDETLYQFIKLYNGVIAQYGSGLVPGSAEWNNTVKPTQGADLIAYRQSARNMVSADDNRTGSVAVLQPRGGGDTVEQIVDMLNAELTLRKNKNYGDPSRGFAAFLEADRSATLAPIFDPSTPDTPSFRMFCWAFVHLNLYGEAGKYTDSLAKFIEQLNVGQPPEQAFQAAYGMSPAKFEVILREYANKGQYKVVTFKIANKTLSREDVKFQSVGDAEILPVKAAVLLKTGQKDAAKALLTRANAAQTSRTSESLCLLAGVTEEPKEALQLLEAAAANGPLDAQGSYLLAKARFDTAPKPLTPRQTIDVLKPAFAALQQGATPQTYVLIADAWLASSKILPTAANLAVIDDGAKLFPNDLALKDRVEALRHRFPDLGKTDK